MRKLTITSFALALAAVCSASAQAQYIIQYADGQGHGYRTEPLYPYVAQPPVRSHPYVTSQPAPAVRPVSKVDPTLVDELRKRGKPKAAAARHDDPKREADTPGPGKKITRTIVVREKPIVRKTYRVVDDPPIVVQREINEEQLGQQPHGAVQDVPHTGRVIRAEAEVTILGPDRMSIRLYRKRDGGDANAKASDKPASNLTKSAAGNKVR